ncbi:MAG TPA: FAD-dependent oxidoreductase [Acetobacteraceae bacterium]|nr:FAD-dependent oxidoreductase [Acetobacteraceae bacterium]
MPPRILVVGAGFAGAVHARELADAGYRVDVIDRRPHIAGNAYDEVDGNGVRIHRYGPHLFHTNNEAVLRWLERFGTFIPYRHRVQALLPGGACVPLPINRATIATVFSVPLDDAAAAAAFLARLAVPCPAPRNAAEYLAATIGTELTDLFFRPYTKKMWGLDLEALDPAVVRRIRLRLDDEEQYFPDDRFQVLPRDGYTALFERMLAHPSIHVTLGESFDPAMARSYAACFNSMAIDEYFDFRFGALPYRSIRFHHRTEPDAYACGDAPVVNFTDAGPFTRQTDWSRLPGHRVRATGSKTLTLEEPCADHENHDERYYPVKAADGRFDAIYRKYRALAEAQPAMQFIGRCGTYQYLDMHQVINQSLQGVRAWIAAHDVFQDGGIPGRGLKRLQ